MNRHLKKKTAHELLPSHETAHELVLVPKVNFSPEIVRNSQLLPSFRLWKRIFSNKLPGSLRMENTSKKPEVPGRIRDVRICTNGAKAFFLKLRNGGFPKKRLPCYEGFQRNASKCKLVLAVYDMVVSIDNFLRQNFLRLVKYYHL